MEETPEVASQPSLSKDREPVTEKTPKITSQPSSSKDHTSISIDSFSSNENIGKLCENDSSKSTYYHPSPVEHNSSGEPFIKKARYCTDMETSSVNISTLQQEQVSGSSLFSSGSNSMKPMENCGGQNLNAGFIEGNEVDTSVVGDKESSMQDECMYFESL